MAAPLDQLVPLIIREANRIGMAPEDLMTIISYETGGTFDPWQKGPITKWGQHRGLIQFGGPQAAQYGYTPGASLDQLVRATGNYMLDRGWQPGMGFANAYSIVNAGSPGRFSASDAAAGGAPGSVMDKVNSAGMSAHRDKARNYLGQYGGGSVLSSYAPLYPSQGGGGFAAIQAALGGGGGQNLATPAPSGWEAFTQSRPGMKTFVQDGMGYYEDPRDGRLRQWGAAPAPATPMANLPSQRLAYSPTGPAPNPQREPMADPRWGGESTGPHAPSPSQADPRWGGDPTGPHAPASRLHGTTLDTDPKYKGAQPELNMVGLGEMFRRMFA